MRLQIEQTKLVTRNRTKDCNFSQDLASSLGPKSGKQVCIFALIVYCSWEGRIRRPLGIYSTSQSMAPLTAVQRNLALEHS